jgi:hypothetical protein
MFMKFISAGEAELAVVDPTDEEKVVGRTWVLFCPERLKTLVLFVAIPANPPVPGLGTFLQVIPFGRRPGFTGEGFIGRDRQDGEWYRIFPCPEMDETKGAP